jgi:succinyl-diaminopimelate desuccinylase
MKGGTAACVSAICQIAAQGIPFQGDLVFAATAGEETDSCGVHRLMTDTSWLPALSGIIIPEPTDFTIVTAHRGLLWLQITTQGKTAHGSTPHLGINAIGAMTSVLNAIEDIVLPTETHAHLGTCSMSINTIHGGKALNVVPDQCTLGIDIRTLPGQDQTVIRQDFQDALDTLKSTNQDFHAEMSIIRSVGALETDDQCPFVRDFCHAVHIPQTQTVGFTTDGPCLAPLGLPTVIFGPGKGSVCHQPDECIALADVERAVDYYKQVILSLLT